MNTTSAVPRASAPHYAWVVVGITFVILLVSAGVRAVPAVLMLPLEQEFGWLRTTTSAALSVNILLYGLTGPFAGSLMARVGVRRVVLSALLLLAAGVAIAPLIRERWQLVALWGHGIGVGTGLVAMVLAATVVNRWFVARRGMVLGILTASGSTGQLVFLPMLAHATARLLFLPYALAGAEPSLIVFAVWYGLDWIATVPPTLRLANEAFGRTRAPIVFGWIAGGHQLGAASIALAAGALRVSSGRYDVAFLGAGALCIGAAALSLAFRREPASSPPSALPLPAPLRPA